MYQLYEVRKMVQLYLNFLNIEPYRFYILNAEPYGLWQLLLFDFLRHNLILEPTLASDSFCSSGWLFTIPPPQCPFQVWTIMPSLEPYVCFCYSVFFFVSISKELCSVEQGMIILCKSLSVCSIQVGGISSVEVQARPPFQYFDKNDSHYCRLSDT